MKRYIFILIVILTTVLYIRTKHLGFYLDDWGFLYRLHNNNNIEGIDRGINLYDIHPNDSNNSLYSKAGLLPWWVGPYLKINYFRPIPSLTFWLDYFLYHDNSSGYHFTNLAIIAFCSALLFYLIFQLSQSIIWALSTCLFFLISPFAYDATRYISARSDSIYTTFFLLTLILYLKYIDTLKPFYLFFSLVSHILALFSKESAVITPLIVVVLNRFGNAKSYKPTSLLLFFATTMLYMLWYRAHNFGASTEEVFITHGDYVIEQGKLAAGDILISLIKVFFGPIVFKLPFGLAVSQSISLFCLILLLSYLCLICRDSKPAMFLLIVPILFVPIYPLFTHLSMSDNWSYLAPSIGICGSLGFLVFRLYHNVSTNSLFRHSSSWIAGLFVFYYVIASILTVNNLHSLNVSRHASNPIIPLLQPELNFDHPIKNIFIFSSDSQSQIIYLAHIFYLLRGTVPRIHVLTPFDDGAVLKPIFPNRIVVSHDDAEGMFERFPLFFKKWVFPRDLERSVAVGGPYLVKPIFSNKRLQSLEFTFEKPLYNPSYKFLTCNAKSCANWNFGAS